MRAFLDNVRDLAWTVYNGTASSPSIILGLPGFGYWPISLFSGEQGGLIRLRIYDIDSATDGPPRSGSPLPWRRSPEPTGGRLRHTEDEVWAADRSCTSIRRPHESRGASARTRSTSRTTSSGNDEGQTLDLGSVSRRFSQILAATALPVIRLHDLRHTSATLGLATGESLKAVSQRLGHADISVTANRYLQVPDETARTAAVELGDTLDGRVKGAGTAAQATDQPGPAPSAAESTAPRTGDSAASDARQDGAA